MTGDAGQHDWTNPSYLSVGNPRQRLAHRVLTSLGIWTRLAEFAPALAGTIPIAVDIPGSDLDVICRSADLDAFESKVTACYGTLADYRTWRHTREGTDYCVGAFEGGGFHVEVFAQDRPVIEQNAYRHMVVEARLLEVGGEVARTEIREMKESGLKTEPAFAAYFQIGGDPYGELLRIADWDDTRLRAAVSSGDWVG